MHEETPGLYFWCKQEKNTHEGFHQLWAFLDHKLFQPSARERTSTRCWNETDYWINLYFLLCSAKAAGRTQLIDGSCHLGNGDDPDEQLLCGRQAALNWVLNLSWLPTSQYSLWQMMWEKMKANENLQEPVPFAETVMWAMKGWSWQQRPMMENEKTRKSNQASQWSGQRLEQLLLTCSCWSLACWS